jgi:hypothetical protein
MEKGGEALDVGKVSEVLMNLHLLQLPLNHSLRRLLRLILTLSPPVSSIRSVAARYTLATVSSAS